MDVGVGIAVIRLSVVGVRYAWRKDVGASADLTPTSNTIRIYIYSIIEQYSRMCERAPAPTFELFSFLKLKK